MKKAREPFIDYAYKIVGRDCGRDRNGVFHCVCGQCRPLRKQGDDGRDSGYNGCEGGNDTNHSSDYKTILVCPLP